MLCLSYLENASKTQEFAFYVCRSSSQLCEVSRSKIDLLSVIENCKVYRLPFIFHKYETALFLEVNLTFGSGIFWCLCVIDLGTQELEGT